MLNDNNLPETIQDAPEPVNFESQISLISPSGKSIMGGTHQFIVSNEYVNYRNTLNFPIFPIGQAGTYKLTLDLRKRGDENWGRFGEYPILVLYQKDDVTNEIKNGNEIRNQQPVERVSEVPTTSKKNRVNSKKRHSQKHK